MMNLCACGCGNLPKGNNKFIWGHNVKFIEKKLPRGINHHAWKGGKTKLGSSQYPAIQVNGHPRASIRGGYVFEHIIKAEKALGRVLPPKAVIHHHTLEQLVICQNQAFHLFLHLRQRALRACGHPHWRRCSICQKWDDPQNLYIAPNNKKTRHRVCHAKKEHDRRHGK